MVEEALSDYYDVITMSSVSTMFELFNNIIPDLILLDIMMPDINGFDALEQLKANIKYEKIPVIFLTSKIDPNTEALGVKMGVADFIKKPFSEPLILNSIKRVLGPDSI